MVPGHGWWLVPQEGLLLVVVVLLPLEGLLQVVLLVVLLLLPLEGLLQVVLLVVLLLVAFLHHLFQNNCNYNNIITLSNQ